MGWWCGVVVKGRGGPGIFQVDMSCMSSPEIFPASLHSGDRRSSLSRSDHQQRSDWRRVVMDGLVQRRKSAPECPAVWMHAGVGAYRNCRGQGLISAMVTGVAETPIPGAFSLCFNSRPVHLQPPLRRSRVVPLHVLYTEVKSSPRYWPTGVLCTGSWDKCIASLALNAPQRQLWWWW